MGDAFSVPFILSCFYLSDLPKLLSSTSSSEDITQGEKSINYLLPRENDLFSLALTFWMTTYNEMFSRSAKVRQKILSKLESFCDFADLDANLDKTKVIAFLITVALKFLKSYSY